VYIFPGSVRQNLDPSADYKEEAIIAALIRVKLWNSVIVPRGGLDAKIDDQFFSHGQAQLFALARAMLRKSKILILDEVTSALDDEMEDVVMDIVRKEFERTTVIAVTHRLRFIQGFDRVVVMDSGNVVEVGSPQELMLQESSRFKELVDLQKRGGD
jgi:ABC-type multidrug transport system fused ATPase/permease subunit